MHYARFEVFSRRWLWRTPSCGMWRRVDLVWTDISEERIASIFRVEKSASEEPAWAACTWRRWLLVRGFLYPEDGSNTFLRNVGSHKIYTVPHPRRRRSSNKCIILEHLRTLATFNKLKQKARLDVSRPWGPKVFQRREARAIDYRLSKSFKTRHLYWSP
jgi:hypothetical protein